LISRRESFQEAPCIALQDLNIETVNADVPPLLPTYLRKEFLKNDDDFISSISPAQSPDAIWAL
jgi:hypothetical protein